MKKLTVHIFDFSSPITENLIKTGIKGGFDLRTQVTTKI